MPLRSSKLAAALTAILLLAGCGAVVDGSGSSERSASGTGDFPSGTSAPSSATVPSPSISINSPSLPAPSDSGSTAGNRFTCPSIVYPYAKLAFTCITTGLITRTGDDIWPLKEYRPVDSSRWQMETGAGHWGKLGSSDLADIATTVRTRMLDDSYGTNPKATTDKSAATTVDGKPAHLLATTVTIDPTYAKTQGTKVKHERLWILAIEVAPDEASLWYASLPDLVSNLWADVPDAIASIRVTP